MKYLNDEGWSAGAPSPSTIRHRAHTRRYGRGSKYIKRKREPFTGSLPDDQRWIKNFEGTHAITADGKVISYKSNPPRELKVAIYRGNPTVAIFDGVEPIRIKIAMALSQSFLGSDEYVLKDGNPLNATLSNIELKAASAMPDEMLIKDYGEQYTINRDGIVYSYARNRRWPLKTSNCGRVNLSCNGVQRLVNVEKLMEEYFTDKC